MKVHHYLLQSFNNRWFIYFIIKRLMIFMNLKKRILITGSAGFIGANLALKLLKEDNNIHIIGIDNMNEYYDVCIKEYRLSQIEQAALSCNKAKWTFVKGNIADKVLIQQLFEEYRFDIVVNLAAQAGVRYSIENPDVYIESNLIGFFNIL